MFHTIAIKSKAETGCGGMEIKITLFTEIVRKSVFV